MSGQYRRRWPGIVLDGLCAAPPACVIYSIFFRCCYRMEQIAQEITKKQNPQSIQVSHQNLSVHDGFPLIHQYLWNAPAKIYF